MPSHCTGPGDQGNPAGEVERAAAPSARSSGVELVDRLGEHLRVQVDVGPLVDGHISAMLWNGVMSTPRLSV